MSTYYERNREARIAYQRKYVLKNRDKKLSYNKQYYQEHKDKMKEQMKNWYHDNKEKQGEYNKRYEKKYPLRKKAKEILHAALQRQVIIKPTTCSHCKKDFPIGQIDGHHDDYTKPCDVTWLCRICHGVFHVSEKTL